MTLIADRFDQPPETDGEEQSVVFDTAISLEESLIRVVGELRRQRLAFRVAPGVWSLRGDVQSLLEGITESKAPGRRVFIGLRCDACGARSMTSLVNGRHVCEICRTNTLPAA